MRLDVSSQIYIITVMPKRVVAEDRRQSLARAAIRVIDDAGLDGARLRDVAALAEATTGAVTHWFGSKDELLDAAMRAIVDDAIAAVDAVMCEAIDAAALAEGTAELLPLDAERRQQWRVQVAFWGRAATDPRARALHQGYYRDIVARVTALLTALRAAGTIAAPADPAILADAMVAAIDGLGTRATLEPDAWPEARQRATLTALLTPLLTPDERPADAQP